MATQVNKEERIDSIHAGQRLDAVLAQLWPEFSRSRITGWIRDGRLRVDGETVKPKLKLAGGERVALSAELEPHSELQPQAIELDVLVDDPAFLVVNKPPGLVVHPGSGNPDGTLVNALLHFDPGLAPLPRAGLVHRLDKDTSGCLLIARTTASHKHLVAALKQREIKRRYQALVWGEIIAGGRIDEPLGRHPVDRRRQVVRHDGRRAVTHYRVAQRLKGATLLDVELETGRTHQIRVHMAHIRYPIIGDPVYGRRGAPAGLSEAQRKAWQHFPRQALHAWQLRFAHPETGEPVEACAPVPDDMQRLIDILVRDESH
ncbi:MULTISPECIES: 23S rRNA pseudouridine(1911/1915/1917) synthase RluD [unclassified Wenzhouxiangella]|uniref:23S rRNA pseudouridine(1911/1915/1917) synthase RluD n=1 Tax=unclassified Wenzhouxiangella TaxID=2613841 RepID=UPI000E325CCE|nr:MULTISPECIES: 23S rRNA pseudouridine(1911/1915/1917) synthase RluD [unclassified Wenzhouxiangella]RFF27237.1 23S rRNA pseudouridine(1911/1915/1917) synthase RluD [Wenzhouxiangella sp. 15181]RFP69235.1 23S rRNA pseudouridine(1911/1915/1917) synthase RluD [Wenzhouxiangella sp. 15190]